jgi:hypothetical protein
MKMRVTAYRGGLQFRDAPSDEPDNIRGQLFLLQTVDVLGPAQNGFLSCSGIVNNTLLQGFVSEKFVRPMLSRQREALVARCLSSMNASARAGQEHHQPFARCVGEMWRAINLPHLDGTDRDQPWSAAAISFMVRNPGPAYQRFRSPQVTAKFTFEAIRPSRKEELRAPFWGVELFERQPQREISWCATTRIRA